MERVDDGLAGKPALSCGQPSAAGAVVPRKPERHGPGLARPGRAVQAAEDARDFHGRCDGRVRYEPLTQRVGYRVDNDEGLGKLAALAGTLPFQVSEVLDGERFEAFVVGEHVVMMRADGSMAHEPPGHAARGAREVVRALGLAFCRLALIHAAGDDWYVLGAERIPQLYDCGEDVQNRVVEHLAEVLTIDGEERRP
jgi:hypothetical protein